MKNFELEEENAKLRAMVGSQAPVTVADHSEEVEYYKQRVILLHTFSPYFKCHLDFFLVRDGNS